MNDLDATYVLISGSATARRMPALIDTLAPRVPNLLTVLTPHASRVISPRELALVPGHRVIESYFDAAILPRPPRGVVLLAPCTFNSLNKLAHGIADNLALSIAAEAIGRGTPVIVALSLNDPLWDHPRTAVSIATLRSWGVGVLEPGLDERGHRTMTADANITGAVLAAFQTGDGAR